MTGHHLRLWKIPMQYTQHVYTFCQCCCLSSLRFWKFRVQEKATVERLTRRLVTVVLLLHCHLWTQKWCHDRIFIFFNDSWVFFAFQWPKKSFKLKLEHLNLVFRMTWRLQSVQGLLHVNLPHAKDSEIQVSMLNCYELLCCSTDFHEKNDEVFAFL